jgi:tetratricopeptide (TPR) repeat protein
VSQALFDYLALIGCGCIQNNVGILLLKQGKYRAAEEYLRLVLEGRRGSYSHDDQHLIHSLLNLGECLRLERKFDECIELHEEALQQLLSRYEADYPGELEHACIYLDLSNKIEASLPIPFVDCVKCAAKLSSIQQERLQASPVSRNDDKEPADLRQACKLAVEKHQKNHQAAAAEMMERAIAKAANGGFGAVPEVDLLEAAIMLADMYCEQGLQPSAQRLLHWVVIRAMEGTRANASGARAASSPLDPDELIQALVQGDELLTTACDTLATLLRARGSQQHLNQAESLLKAVQSACSIRYGPRHRKTLECSGNLGHVLASSGHIAEAEKYCRQAYEGFLALESSKSGKDRNLSQKSRQSEVVAGQSGRSTGISAKNPDAEAAVQAAFNLSIVLCVAGKFPEASSLGQQVVRWRREQLGAMHPSTLNAMLSHATVLRHLHQYREAEEIYDYVLCVKERNLGPEHEEVRSVLVAMALCKKEAGQPVVAQNLYQRVAKSSSKVLSATSSKAPSPALSPVRLGSPSGGLDSRSPLASVGRLNSAHSTHSTLSIGEGGLSSLSAAEDAVHALHAVGRLEEAETLCRHVLDVYKEHSGTTSGQETPVGNVTVRNLGCIHQLALILEDQKTADSLTEANDLLQMVVDKRTELLGSSHPDTVDSKNHLASVMRNQERYLDAESLYRDVLQYRREKFGDEDPHTLTSMVLLFTVRYAVNYWCSF